MIRAIATAGLLAVALTACVTVPMTPPSLNLLDYALDTAPADLESRAEARDARAQYALSVVYRYGLKGTPRDTGRANSLRASATAQRGYTPITQYIAGLNGAPGRTAIINIPRYDLNGYEAEANDRCAATLDRGVETPTAIDACQGEARFRDLNIRWQAAAPPSVRVRLAPVMKD